MLPECNVISQEQDITTHLVKLFSGRSGGGGVVILLSMWSLTIENN